MTDFIQENIDNTSTSHKTTTGGSFKANKAERPRAGLMNGHSTSELMTAWEKNKQEVYAKYGIKE